MNKNQLLVYSYISSGVVLLLSLACMTILPKMLVLLFSVLGGCIFLISFLFCQDRRLDIIVLLILATECFYIPTGGIIAQDLLISFTLLLIFKMLLHGRKAVDGIYKFVIFSLFGLALISSVNAMSEFSQSYINSILPFRHYIILLIFFCITDWVDKGYKIDRYLTVTSFVAFSLFIIQYFLYGKVQFLNVPKVSERLGDYRLHFQTLTPIFGAIVAFNSFIAIKKGLYKWFALSVYLIGLFFTVFVNQTRTYMFGLLLSAFLIFVFSNVSSKIKFRISIGLVAMLVVSFPLYITPFTELIDSSLNEITTSSGNYGVRQEAINYYVNLGKEHFVWGNGLLNLRTGSDWLIPGISKGYFWVDIGLYGLFFLHGLGGVSWYFLVLHVLLKSLKKIIRFNVLYLLGYAAFGVLTLTTVGTIYFYLFPTAYCLAINQSIRREKLGLNIKDYSI